jgi:hypothetical protein
MRFHPLDKSSKAMFARAHDQIADGNAAFMEVMTGPNPLTPEEVDRLVARNPRWSRFAGFGAKPANPKG